MQDVVPFCELTTGRLGQECADRLKALLGDKAAAGRGGLLAELKADPGQVGLETLLREIDKLSAVRALGLPADLFADASEKLVEAWRARAVRSYPSDLPTAPRPVRLTLLAALCWVWAAEITDALVDLLIGLVHKINTRADRRVERELTDDLRRVTSTCAATTSSICRPTRRSPSPAPPSSMAAATATG